MPNTRYGPEIGISYVHQEIQAAKAGFESGHAFIVDQPDHPQDGEAVYKQDLEEYLLIRFRPDPRYQTGLIMITQTNDTTDD